MKTAEVVETDGIKSERTCPRCNHVYEVGDLLSVYVGGFALA